MAGKDFYQLLGISKSATAEEIKAAYRKLARQYHPDVNKAPDAQRKFTEVQKAYDVLSDTKQRGVYDQFGPAAFETGSAQDAAARAASGQGRGPHYNWSNVAGRRTGSGVGGGSGGASQFDPDDLNSIFESMFGGAGFGSRGGGGGGGGGGVGKEAGRKTTKRKATKKSPAWDGTVESQEEDLPKQELFIDFLTAARGGNKSVRIDSSGATIEVKIPPGIEQDAQLRAKNVGNSGSDVTFIIRIQAHKYFKRGEPADTGKGLDLYVEVPISISEATLGGPVSVPTLTQQVDLTIPPGTPSGSNFRLRGLGIVDSVGRKGDLYAKIKIVPPPGAMLSPIEATALREMASRGGPCRVW